MNLLRKYWLRWNVRRHSSGDNSAIKRLYLVEDPWGLKNEQEQTRFVETNRLIAREAQEKVNSLLEIGCGEGAQSVHLSILARQLTGIDPSPLAIERAKRKELRNATFHVGDLVTFKPASPERFDVVTACEMIYYHPDCEASYSALSGLGQLCIVTYFEGKATRLDPFFRSKRTGMETIRCGGNAWRVVWWRPATG
jgi:2-polyprenyl-3-methyl-5-hydroxy-6-metoxy-1,4-benzoquinol methylase